MIYALKQRNILLDKLKKFQNLTNFLKPPNNCFANLKLVTFQVPRALKTLQIDNQVPVKKWVKLDLTWIV